MSSGSSKQQIMAANNQAAGDNDTLWRALASKNAMTERENSNEAAAGVIETKAYRNNQSIVAKSNSMCDELGWRHRQRNQRNGVSGIRRKATAAK